MSNHLSEDELILHFYGETDRGDAVAPLVASQLGIKREFSGREAWVHGRQ